MGRILFGQKVDKWKNDIFPCDVFDKFQKDVPYEILEFIKQPFYEKKAEIIENCDPIMQNKSHNICMVELDITKPIDLEKNKNTYIKLYKIPNHIDLKDVFYKFQSKELCAIYYKDSKENTVDLNKVNSDSEEVFCYLSLSKQLNIKEEKLVREKEEVYLQNNGKFELVNKKDWEFSFYKIPEFIKWKMSGYEPVEDNHITILTAENRNVEIDFYVKDYNYFSQAPNLILSQAVGYFSDFKFLRLKSAELILENIWKLKYSLEIKSEYKENQNKRYKSSFFQKFESKIQPFSQIISGDPVHFKFYVIPAVKVEAFEKFDSINDSKANTIIASDDSGQRWLSSFLSLSNQIEVRYTFNINFLSSFISEILYKISILMKDFSFKKQEEHKVLDYFKINKSQYSSGSMIKDQLFFTSYCNPKKTIDDNYIFQNSHCVCSDNFTQEQRDGKVYITNVCSNKIDVYLNSKTLKHSNDSESENPSFYFFYAYNLELGNVFLNNKYYEESTIKDIRVDSRDLTLESIHKPAFFEERKNLIGNVFHIFFNLKPTFKGCISDPDSSFKECKIHYILDEIKGTSTNQKLESFSKGQKDFSKERALQAKFVLPCKKGDEEFCSCSQPTFFSQSFGLKTMKGIEIKCLFPKDQSGSFTVHLKTESPYIYFLNKNIGIMDDAEKYKRTPDKELYIP